MTTPPAGDWRVRLAYPRADAHLFVPTRMAPGRTERRPLCGRAIRLGATRSAAALVTMTPCRTCLADAMAYAVMRRPLERSR